MPDCRFNFAGNVDAVTPTVAQPLTEASYVSCIEFAASAPFDHIGRRRTYHSASRENRAIDANATFSASIWAAA